MGMFIDNYQNASGNLERCLVRASEYHRWSGNKNEDIITAYFYDKTFFKKEKILKISILVVIFP